MLKLTIGSLLALWTVDMLRPLLISEAILLLALVCEQFTPTGFAHRRGRDLFVIGTVDS
jgi:hypothetical protein